MKIEIPEIKPMQMADITLPEKLKIIPEKCFYRCSSLLKITLPTDLEKIEKNAFTGCSVKEVIYEGTKKQRKKIKIEKGNSEFSTSFDS